MRREPQQKRSHDLVAEIERATVALLTEHGYTALNTNAIAERAGIGIKSLYHFFPNKEAIVYRLADRWLSAIRDAQTRVIAHCKDWHSAMAQMDQVLNELDSEFSGYGALWQAMDLIPELTELEVQHEQQQLTFWSELLQRLGCDWPEDERRAVVAYFYRTTDVARQLSKIQGQTGTPLWHFHVQTMTHLIEQAIKTPSLSKLSP
jgi:AcrR family transcriptional regulator